MSESTYKDCVNIVLLAPSQVVLEEGYRFADVEVIALQKASVEVLVEEQPLDLVDHLLFGDDGIDEGLQLLPLLKRKRGQEAICWLEKRQLLTSF